MTTALTRRALFAFLRGGAVQVRMPWAISENEFVEGCTRCGKCAAACPGRIIVAGHGGYPIVDFSRVGCSFCGACAEACSAGCFDRKSPKAWSQRAAISPTCIEASGVTCRMCQEVCVTGAIRFRPKIGGGGLTVVDEDGCTGCGACVARCPVQAIAIVALRAAEGAA